MSDLIPIIICSGERGQAVVFGRVASMPDPGEPVALIGARMILSWSAECGGLFGLAAKGPRAGTRITASVVSHMDTAVRQILGVSPEAAAAIDAWPAA